MLLLIMLMIKVSIKMLSAMLQWAQTAGCTYNALIKFFYTFMSNKCAYYCQILSISLFLLILDMAHQDLKVEWPSSI